MYSFMVLISTLDHVSHGFHFTYDHGYTLVVTHLWHLDHVRHGYYCYYFDITASSNLIQPFYNFTPLVAGPCKSRISLFTYHGISSGSCPM